MVSKSVTALGKLGDVLRRKLSVGPAGKVVVAAVEKEMVDESFSCGGGLSCCCQYLIGVSNLSIEPSVPLMVQSSTCWQIVTVAGAEK